MTIITRYDGNHNVARWKTSLVALFRRGRNTKNNKIYDLRIMYFK